MDEEGGVKYRVRFLAPDGEEAWLGEAGQGPTNKESESTPMDLEEAQEAADWRNQVHGSKGFYYWIVPTKEIT